MNRYLGIIPARSGSKRLLDKNVRLLNGLPLVQHTIEAAKKSTMLDDFVVTTDDLRIIELARLQNLKFKLRDCSLSQDSSSSIDVVLDVLKSYAGYTHIVLLQPTSPLRTAKHIDESIKLFERNKLGSLFSVCPLTHNPLKSVIVNDDNSVTPMRNFKDLSTPDQLLPSYYSTNGAIYINNIDELLMCKSFITEKSGAYLMNHFDSVDVNTQDDLDYCEYILNEKNM